jgi:hypothetical protein
MPTLRTLADLQDEFCGLWADLRKVDLILTLLADPANRTRADFARSRTGDFNRLVYLLGHRAASMLTVPLSGLATRRLGIALRLSFREGSRLAFAAAPQLLDDLFQLGDPTLLLGDPAPELRVFLKELFGSRHV